jgi:L-threonylcarbamoyladenylate synthase
MIAVEQAAALVRCIRAGGVAVFPTDTVYGVCCDPQDEVAAARLYELKGRPPEKPAAVMFFALEPALATLTELHDAEHRAAMALLPGPVTLLLANRQGRFPAACGPDPHTLGLRVPRLTDTLAALETVPLAVMQSSANLSGGPDPRTLAEVPKELLAGVDLVLDGGELPGTPSTVIDLRRYASHGEWRLLREGALSSAAAQRALA